MSIRRTVLRRSGFEINIVKTKDSMCVSVVPPRTANYSLDQIVMWITKTKDKFESNSDFGFIPSHFSWSPLKHIDNFLEQIINEVVNSNDSFKSIVFQREFIKTTDQYPKWADQYIMFDHQQ